MSRSFKNFLTAYCQELTGTKTTSLKKLFLAAESDSPRVREPLMLLALTQGREAYLLRLADGTEVNEHYQEFLNAFSESDLVLEEYLLTLPERNRFRRPLDAWFAEKGRLGEDRAMLLNVASVIKDLLNQKGLSRAEACRVTGLNKGNFYAFLKGDTAKLSRSTAIAAYDKLAAL